MALPRITLVLLAALLAFAAGPARAATFTVNGKVI